MSECELACPLARRWIRGPGADPAVPVVIALHSDGADVDELVELCRRVAPGAAICALQGPRSRNPFLSSGHAGALAFGAYRGFAWYRSADDGAIEPASFGDALGALAAFLAELDPARARVLLGRREGATLALAAAACFPELLDGVVALDGEPPRLPGLRAPGGDVPIIQVDERGEAAIARCAAIARFLGELEVRHGSD